jgi:hypothetical protein
MDVLRRLSGAGSENKKSRIAKHLLFGLGLLAAGAAWSQQAPNLKEFTLRAPMSDCPAGTLQRLVRDPAIDCVLGPTTLANQPVKRVLLTLFEGRIQSVMFDFKQSGLYVSREVPDALTEKFGRPTSDKPHINQTTWKLGTDLLFFDGVEGSVILLDAEAERRISSIASRRNKKDL